MPTILLIEDDDIIALNMRAILEKCAEKYTVHTARDGRQGCEMAEQCTPDLIITDWEMPILSGIEVIRTLKQNPRTVEIPVIMTTGVMVKPENLETALEAGAIDFFRKPVNPVELVARVRLAIDLSASHKKIQQQNVIIQERMDDIHASILYTSRIQKFLLPEEDQLNRRLQDFFIYYQPKDVLSGDFFWFNARRREVIVVAADCTGHGVPGAFISLLGITTLNQIIRDFGTLEVDTMLYELNERLYNILSKGSLEAELQDQLQDGMDIAVCKVRMREKTVSFVGAKRPLYYIEGGKLQIIKGSGYSVGSVSALQHVEYEKHEIQLQSGDAIYIFSDGITDQFNDADTKKLGPKKFQQMLQEIYQWPMAEQKKHIQSRVQQWQGTTPQTDDQLVFGVRI